uniref:Arrestin-like N-terminal domain-containing protein n=1 Tax=Heliothis virescens TaxID=7102 RepID=A0A2A4K7K0_HELVI
MGFENGVVTLNNASHTYLSGQTINGHLSFSLDDVKVIHGIYVEAKGFRKVHWTSERRSWLFPRFSYKVDHESYEVCFRRTTFLCGGVTGDYVIKSGRHDFKFDCPIPVHCPSSFEGKYEQTRYSFNIVMLTTGIFSYDKKIVVPFRVQCSKPKYKPMEFQLDENWCVSVAYSQMPLELATGIERPGQVLNIEVTCKNKKTSNIKKVVLHTNQSVGSKATQSIAASDTETSKMNNTVAQVKKDPTSNPTKRNWIVEFQVFTKVDGGQTKPIVLGTIPLTRLPTNMMIPLIPPPGESTSLPPAIVINPPIIMNSRNNGGCPRFSSKGCALNRVPMGESKTTGDPPSYWHSVSTPVPRAADNVDGSTEKNPLDTIPEVTSNQQ